MIVIDGRTDAQPIVHQVTNERFQHLKHSFGIDCTPQLREELCVQLELSPQHVFRHLCQPETVEVCPLHVRILRDVFCFVIDASYRPGTSTKVAALNAGKCPFPLQLPFLRAFHDVLFGKGFHHARHVNPRQIAVNVHSRNRVPRRCDTAGRNHFLQMFEQALRRVSATISALRLNHGHGTRLTLTKGDREPGRGQSDGHIIRRLRYAFRLNSPKDVSQLEYDRAFT